MKEETHIMVDIETMGNTPQAPMLSIAAVVFDMSGNTGQKFYRVIDLKSTLELGMKPDASTIYWWMIQKDEARIPICSRQKQNIKRVLSDFNAFLKEAEPNSKKRYLWANSPSFDLSIIRNHYQTIGLKPNWLFWMEMDVRTITSLMKEVKKGIKKELEDDDIVLHNALDDCIIQVEILTKTMKALNLC